MFNFDKTLDFYAKALPMRAERSRILANNIANANTPKFLARDFDVQSELRALRDNSSMHKTQLTATHMNHVDLRAGAGAMDVKYRIPLMPSIDGNTVDVNFEKMKFAQESARYLTTLRFISGSISSLRSAIKGE